MRDLPLHTGQLFFSRGIVLVWRYVVVKPRVVFWRGGEGWCQDLWMTKRSPHFGGIWGLGWGGMLRPGSNFWHRGYIASLPAVD